MRIPSIPIMSNPYLLRLTKDERNPGWLRITIKTLLVLWIGSCALIWGRILGPSLRSSDVVMSMMGLPLAILAIAGFLMIFVFVGAQLTFVETQSEQLPLLYRTNISVATIFLCLVLGTIYRTRIWFAWIIGLCPYLLWLSCQSYLIGWALPADLRSFTTLLGHRYVYWDGPGDLMMLLELFWFISLAISIVGFSFLSLLCCVSFTMKSKKVMLSAAVVLSFTLPVVLGIILLVTPEGFLSADTAYRNAAVNASVVEILLAGIMIATLPFVALLGAQRLFRRWTFK